MYRDTLPTKFVNMPVRELLARELLACELLARVLAVALALLLDLE